MAKDWAEAFYNGKKWRRCRKSYIDERILIDGGLCEQCHDNLGYIVHHKITLTPVNITDPDISLNHENLMYVCKDCHDEFEGHGVGRAGTPGLVLFDEQGMPVGRIEEVPPKIWAGVFEKTPSPPL